MNKMVRRRAEYERIFLEPLCCADPHGDRQWCEDDVWDGDDCPDHSPAVEFIRKDIAEAREACTQTDAPTSEDHPLARMVAWDEEMEVEHPGWMTGAAPPATTGKHHTATVSSAPPPSPLERARELLEEERRRYGSSSPRYSLGEEYWHAIALRAITRALSEREAIVRWLGARAEQIEAQAPFIGPPDKQNDLLVRAMTMRSLARHFASGAHLKDQTHSCESYDDALAGASFRIRSPSQGPDA